MSIATNTARSTPTPTERPPAAGSLVVAGRRRGRTVLSELRSVPPLALRPLPAPDGVVRVAIVQCSATLVAGDDVGLRVIVGPGAHLEMIEISATICHPGPAQRPIRQSVTAEVSDDASLALAEQPLVICAGSHLTRVTRIRLSDGGRCLHREALVLGREGESPGAATARLRVERERLPVLDDTTDTRNLAALRSAAVLGPSRCLATAGLWGADPEPVPPGALAIGPRDTLLRSPGPHARAALAPVDAAWSYWLSLMGPPGQAS